MTTTKFDIEKFDRNMSFTMWQVKMRAILIHNGLHQALLGASIKSHINEFSTILMDLENMEISYDDEDQALMLLRSLPLSYKHFRDTLFTIDKL
ncbi:hypothetical protein ACOSQ2_031966 [Xanthoceras sorbifolium]